MSVERPFFTVDNHENFGKLIRKWVTGVEQRRPNTVAGLVALLDEYEIVAEVPDEWTTPGTIVDTVKYFELEDDVLSITLPSKEMLRKADVAIGLQNGGYQFPIEYDDAYSGPRKPSLHINTRRMIQHARLADYSIDICM